MNKINKINKKMNYNSIINIIFFLYNINDVKTIYE